MTNLFVNTNNYGLILLRASYEDAIAESEEMYDRECARKGNKQPKSARTTKYLLAVKENIISGQIGLCIPPQKTHIEVPAEAIRGEHIDNPLWMHYDYLHGEPKSVLGAMPFGGFGFGIVDPKNVRKILDGHLSPDLVNQVRSSPRKYTIDVHDSTSNLIRDLLRKGDIKDYLQRNIQADSFEELVADLLRDQGCDVFLTSRTRDGGKDIWASITYAGRRVTALIECKIRKSDSAIDPAIARAVVGSYFIERTKGIDVDCALLVTTSDNIGPSILDIQQQLRKFAIKDCNDIISWMQQYGSLRNGLWVPTALSDFLI